MNQDPIGLAGGINVCAYVKNPTLWVDPIGLSGWASFPPLNPNLPGNQAAVNAALGNMKPQSAPGMSGMILGNVSASDGFGLSGTGFNKADSIAATMRADPNLRTDARLPRSDGLLWQDGCGDSSTDHSVPDAIALVYDNPDGSQRTHQFKLFEACEAHDRCYETTDKSFAKRMSCDATLKSDIINSCIRSGASGKHCHAVGNAYYMGVRFGGGGAFERAKP